MAYTTSLANINTILDQIEALILSQPTTGDATSAAADAAVTALATEIGTFGPDSATATKLTRILMRSAEAQPSGLPIAELDIT